MGSPDFAGILKQSHDAADAIAKGDPGPYKALYSRSDGITLGNPFGGFARGWDQVVEQIERAASYYRDGRFVGVEKIEHVATPDFAYTVEIERFETKVGGSADLTEVALRVSCVYRRESEGWKLVHRHADPRVARQTAESVLQR